MLVRGVGTAVLLALLVWWWAVPATLHAEVATEAAQDAGGVSDEPMCASWSFGEATPATDGVGIPMTVVVRSCDG
jgi:hypothetical protein